MFFYYHEEELLGIWADIRHLRLISLLVLSIGESLVLRVVVDIGLEPAPFRSARMDGYLFTLIEYPDKLFCHIYINLFSHIFKWHRIVAVVDKDMAVMIDLTASDLRHPELFYRKRP